MTKTACRNCYDKLNLDNSTDVDNEGLICNDDDFSKHTCQVNQAMTCHNDLHEYYKIN